MLCKYKNISLTQVKVTQNLRYKINCGFVFFVTCFNHKDERECDLILVQIFIFV